MQCERKVATNNVDAGRSAGNCGNRDLSQLSDCFDDSWSGAVTDHGRSVALMRWQEILSNRQGAPNAAKVLYAPSPAVSSVRRMRR